MILGVAYTTEYECEMALRFCRPALEVHASSYDGLVIARQGSNGDEYNNRTSGNSKNSSIVNSHIRHVSATGDRHLGKYKSVLHNGLSKDSQFVTTGG